jgi:hypothetical protein
MEVQNGDFTDEQIREIQGPEVVVWQFWQMIDC